MQMLNSMLPDFAQTYNPGKHSGKSLVKSYGTVLLEQIGDIKDNEFNEQETFQGVTKYFRDCVRFYAKIRKECKNQHPAKGWALTTTAQGTKLRDLLDFYIQPLTGRPLNQLFPYADFDDLSILPSAVKLSHHVHKKPFAASGSGPRSAPTAAASTSPADHLPADDDLPAADDSDASEHELNYQPKEQEIAVAVAAVEAAANRKPTRITLHATDEFQAALDALPESHEDDVDKAKHPDTRLKAFGVIALRTAEAVMQGMMDLGLEKEQLQLDEYQDFSAALGSMVGGIFCGVDKLASLVSTVPLNVVSSRSCRLTMSPV